MDLLYKVVITLKNACLLSKTVVLLPRSTYVVMFLDLLYKEGVIFGYSFQSSTIISVFLRPTVVLKVDLLSRQSYRGYKSYNQLYKDYYFQDSLVIVSTSRGLKTVQQAVVERIGGECLCRLSFI